MVVKHGHVTRLSEQRITRMSMPELIKYEAILWTWLEALRKSNVRSLRIVDQLNAIHREVEWRAGQKEWDDAAHS